MVKINYCPSCGCELSEGSFVCPACELDIEELFARNYLLESNRKDNSIELHDDEISEVILDEQNDEIVIVVSENRDGEELVIDLDEMGVDLEKFGSDINIVVQLEDADDFAEIVQAVEWRYDDDPYGIVYYEFPGV